MSSASSALLASTRAQHTGFFPLNTPVTQKEQDDFADSYLRMLLQLRMQITDREARRDIYRSHLLAVYSNAAVDGIKLNSSRVHEAIEREETYEDDAFIYDEGDYDDVHATGRLDAGLNGESVSSGTQAKTRNRTTAIKSQTRPFQAPLTAATKPATATKWQDDFQAAMLKRTVATREAGVRVVHRFTDTEIVSFTNIFFADVMGQTAIDRVSTIAHDVHVTSSDGVDHLLAERLRNVVDVAPMPSPCEQMFRRMEAYCHMSMQAISPTRTMLMYARLVEWITAYQEVVEAYANEDVAVVSELKRYNIMLHQYDQPEAPIHQYLQATTLLSIAQIKALCGVATVLDVLVKHYGDAILALLPEHAYHVFRQTGPEKSLKAVTLWRSAIAESNGDFTAICDWLADHLVYRVLDGEQPTFSTLKTASSRSVMCTLYQTVAPN